MSRIEQFHNEAVRRVQ